MFLSLLVFLSVVCLFIGLLLKKSYSPLKSKFKTNHQPDNNDEELSILDEIWNTKPATRKDAYRIALFGAVIGLLLGFMLRGGIGVFLAVAGFVLAPRINNYVIKKRTKKQFRKMFPRAVSELAVVARTGTIFEGINEVAEKYPAPISDVFGYIAECIRNNMDDYEAIKKAAEEFQIKELEPLANAVRVISELGGGQKAAEILTSAAEMVKFQDKFTEKVNLAISENINDALLSNSVLIGFFALMAMSPDSEYRLAMIEHPVMLATGVGVLILQWILIDMKLKSFKRECGL